ncbi:MAG: glycosyltransferase family 39 protein [Ruminococcus sp.]|nr:glycosyltransferase family 39 protein [Ruminococcus sp.]
MSKSDNEGKIVISEKYVDALIRSLAAHPYLWALAVCMFINPFYLGAEENVPSNALYIETLLVLAAGYFVIYRLYRNSVYSKNICGILAVAFIAADFVLLKIYANQPTKGIYMLLGGCAIIFLLYYFSRTKNFSMQLNSLLILALSFMVKFYYVYYTSVYTRQNDVHKFGGEDGHAAYIEYILYNHKLPDFDIREVWQFCHPPLHHIICAVWIEISENILGVGYNPARESLQTLTLFYSMAIMITAYKIFRHFKLEGFALYVPMIIVAFHPAFILMSGAINNDVLSVVFMMGAILCTLKWYENQTFKGILKIALCIGLGMMTKLTAALVAPPIAVVFLIVFVRKFKTDGKKLFAQFASFAVVCVPLGLWFEIKNYIKYKVPITYVQEMSENVTQYIGDQSFFSRITDFSSSQFDSVFEQWLSYSDSGEAISYNEYNPLVTLLKNSLFGEAIDESNFLGDSYMLAICRIFFWLAAVLALICFAMMIVTMFRKSCGMDTAQKTLFGGFYLMMMVNFYKMAHDYPFTCTMNFRYITPTVIVTTLFLGISIRDMSSKNKVGNVASLALSAAALIFAAISVMVYIVVCYPNLQ